MAIDNIKDAEQLVNNLILVKEEYQRMCDLSKVSIRKDVVSSNLKDIIQNTNNYEELKIAINNFINDLWL